MIPTKEQMAEWRKLADAATPLPLYAEEHHYERRRDVTTAPIGDRGRIFVADDMRVADAEFFIASRTAVPALLDAVEELEAEHERVLDEVMRERDEAEDAVQRAHVALGGDGEWCAKLGLACAPGETGDLRVDVPAMAADLVAEVARLRAKVEAADALAEAAELLRDNTMSLPATLRDGEVMLRAERVRMLAGAIDAYRAAGAKGGG